MADVVGYLLWFAMQGLLFRLAACQESSMNMLHHRWQSAGPSKGSPGAAVDFCPQFDGLECFETMVPHPSASSQASTQAAYRPPPAQVARSWRTSSQSSAVKLAPQFDGLECYETIIPGWR